MNSYGRICLLLTLTNITRIVCTEETLHMQASPLTEKGGRKRKTGADAEGSTPAKKICKGMDILAQSALATRTCYM